MASRFAEWWLRPRIVFTTLAAALIVIVILSPGTEVAQGPPLSTRSRTISGSRGLRDVLDRLGWHTSERIIPYIGSIDSTSTYVLLNTPIEPSAGEVHVLLEAVRRGAKAIVVPEAHGNIADSIGVHASDKWFGNYHAIADTLFGHYDRVDTLREAFGVFSARTFHRYLVGNPRSDSDTVGEWPSQARQLLSIRTPVLQTVHPEIAVLPVGHGEVVAIADPTFFRNDILRKTAGTVLAIRILEDLDSTRTSPIVFDEYHQGFGTSASLTAIIEDALVDTSWGRLALQLAAAALLYLFMIGVRPIVPVSRGRFERRSPLEHVGALSRAYEAIGASRLAVQRLVRGVRRRHPLGTAAALSDEAYLTLLKVRLPKLGGDIDTLTRALSLKPSTEQLVSAGAAIDHIERNLIT
ncbi:MAG: DUF4350 domain-containing protein [Gemmatimonadaceae bacterium]